jgi:hypothetical protein
MKWTKIMIFLPFFQVSSSPHDTADADLLVYLRKCEERKIRLDLMKKKLNKDELLIKEAPTVYFLHSEILWLKKNFDPMSTFSSSSSSCHVNLLGYWRKISLNLYLYVWWLISYTHDILIMWLSWKRSIDEHNKAQKRQNRKYKSWLKASSTAQF